MADKWMSIMEAAVALGLDYQRVRLLIIRGKLDGRQVDGRYSAWRVSSWPIRHRSRCSSKRRDGLHSGTGSKDQRTVWRCLEHF